MILTQHRLDAIGRCPADGTEDLYSVVVETTEMIPVETILLAVADATAEPIFQEDLTRELARRLGARVSTSGTHSGVETTCVCEGA